MPLSSTAPDWYYVLLELWELYRYLPAGGSDRIRSHQRTVREAISRVMQSDPEIRLPEPCEKPVI
ncbi:MAG: dimethlysulfonioproprionate lyase DddL, partial [Pseudomonadota bacterium]